MCLAVMALTAAILLMSSWPAAALTVEQYSRFRSQADLAESLSNYIGGLRDGLVSSTVAASAVGKSPVFCVPRTVQSISTQEFMSLIDGSLSNWTLTSEPPPATEDLGMVAILILRDRFPCRR